MDIVGQTSLAAIVAHERHASLISEARLSVCLLRCSVADDDLGRGGLQRDDFAGVRRLGALRIASDT